MLRSASGGSSTARTLTWLAVAAAITTGWLGVPPSAPAATSSVGGAISPPASGALFGAWVSHSNTGMTVNQREKLIGRKYRIVHRYHGWKEKLPTSQEVRWAKGGRILYLSWDAEIFGKSSHPTWRQIAEGSQDAVIDAQAARIKSFRKPLFMDFSQEPEGGIDDGGYGTASDFAAAFRHIVKRFRAKRATNVSWVWSVEGGSDRYSLYTGGLYPGDEVVDWIGWDPYNWYTCRDNPWVSFDEKVHGFYDWLQANGHADKPHMLSEYGSHEGEPVWKGQWFRDGLAALKAGSLPNLKAIVYFDSLDSRSGSSTCQWRIDSSTSSLEGFRQLANDAYLSP